LEDLDVRESLEAMGADQLLTYLQAYTVGEEIPQAIHEKALEHLRTYHLLGGMPQVIKVYRDTLSLLEADKVKYSILNTYRDDFAKYKTRIDLGKLQEVFDKLGTTVGKKITYVDILPQERSAVTDRILTLFVHARLLYRAYHSSANNLPLKAEINRKRSKGILLDIGLYLALQGLSIADISQDKNLFFSNQGELAEQFIGQHLLYSQPSYMHPELYYWCREKAQSNAEVDFVIQQGNSILPIEVKSGKTGTLKSLCIWSAKGATSALKTGHRAFSAGHLKEAAGNNVSRLSPPIGQTLGLSVSCVFHQASHSHLKSPSTCSMSQDCTGS